MKDKLCNKCRKEKIDSKKNKSGLCGECFMKKYKKDNHKSLKKYHKKYKRKYYLENKKELCEENTKYYLENKKEMDKYRRGFYDKNAETLKKRSKEQYENNKELRKKQNLEYVKARYKIDEGFRIRRRLGTALSSVIRNYIKTGKVSNPMKKYFIDWEGIMEVLTPIPKPRSKYHVDHIIPLFRFDLSNFEQIQIAFAPENHRWMLAKDNMSRNKNKRTSDTC